MWFALAPPAFAQSLKDLTISGPVYSGNAFTATVTGSNDLINSSISLNNCDGCSFSPTTFNFPGSAATFQVTIYSTSARTAVSLVLTYGTNLNKAVTSNSFDVQLVSPTKLMVTNPPTASAGTPFNITVTATDDANRVAYGFNNNVTLTSSDPSKGQLGSIALSTGTGSVAATLVTPGTWTITAASGLASGTGTIQITPTASSLQIVAPSSVNAGDQFPITVRALDSSGNLATAFSGSVTLTSTDPAAASLGTVNLSGGTGTLAAVVLKTGGARTITGKDTTTGITGTAAVTVNPGQATSLVVVPSAGTIAAGTPFSVIVTAQDFYGNIVTSYSPTVTLTSTDSAASGMQSFTLASVQQTIQTTHFTAGIQTITATGAGTPPITGSATVTITALSASRFVVSAPATTIAGVAFSLTVTARDVFGNLAPNYSGTVTFSSSDSQAGLPANVPWAEGPAPFRQT
jgi:hypothetical protein